MNAGYLRGGMNSKVEIKAKEPQRLNESWGFQLVFARTDKYAGKVLFIRSGGMLSLQYHEKKDETIYVHNGEIQVELMGTNGQEVYTTLKSRQCMRIEPLVRHRIQAIKDTTLFEVSTPELEDIKRLERLRD